MTNTRGFDLLYITDTPAEPDVLLFSNLLSSVLVAGTYHLEEDGLRTGNLLVYVVDPSTFKWYLLNILDLKGSKV